MKLIKDFINSFDFSLLPIGPQADVIQKLEDLNGVIPYEVSPNSNERYRYKKYPKIQFSVTKKFHWSRGTVKDAKLCKDIFDGVDVPYRSLGGIYNLWERPDARRHHWYGKRFKDRVMLLDNTLRNKRRNNAVWMEDKDELNELVSSVKESLIKSFVDFKNYVETTPGIDSKCHMVVEDSDYLDYTPFNNIIQSMWRLDNNDSYILFNKYKPSGNYIAKEKVNDSSILENSHIYIIHQFPDAIMNIFHGDETNQPMMKLPIGKIIVAYELNVKRLINISLGNTNSRHRGNYSVKAFHRPIYNGLKHPFINIARNNLPGKSSANHEQIPLDECKPTMKNMGSNCSGNMDFQRYIRNLSFASWSEDMYTWATTFRVGTTHPLNNITTTYYGHPKMMDPKMSDRYLDVQGFSTKGCYDGMKHRLAGNDLPGKENMTQIEDICENHCFDNIRKKCYGYKHIQKKKAIKKVDKLFNNNNNPIYRDISNYIQPPSQDVVNELDTVVPLSAQESQLERDMIEWIRNNR